MQLINAFACDDIRWEILNKFSYMGVYDQNIVANQLPLRIPKLCFVEYLRGEVGDYQLKQILMGPNHKIGEVNFVDKAKIISNTENFIIRSSFNDIELKDFGEYELQLYVNGQLVSELTYKFRIIKPRP